MQSTLFRSHAVAKAAAALSETLTFDAVVTRQVLTVMSTPAATR